MATAHILVVEDNRIVAEDIKQTLESLGYGVPGIATSGEKALALAGRAPVDLALMDINLGRGMNGIELAARFRQDHRIPVVFLTAHADRDTLEKAKQTEPLGYLIKPFDERELRSTIDIALHQCRMARKVRESEEKYRSFVENFQGIAFRADENWDFEFITGKVEQITGWQETDFISGRVAFEELIHAEDIIRVRQERKAFLAGPHRSTRDEYRLRDRHGKVHWIMENVTRIDSAGDAARLDGTIQDITQRKAAEAEIAFLKTAVDHTAESITVTDTRARIQYVNRAFETMTGYTRAELIGKNPSILKSGAHDPGFYEELWQTLGNRQTWYGVFTNRKKDGGLFQEKATISPVLDENGRVTHYIAVKRDITDDLKKEKMLRQSQKMESIGTLAGGIAHDFNNILSPIIGFAQLCLKNAEKGSMLEDSLNEINNAGQRAKELVRQILTFARYSSEGASPIRIHVIIKEVIKFIRSSIPTNVAIETDVDRAAYVMADPTQIHQVVMNLCTNAYQAMENESGTIRVSLKDERIGLPENGGNADNGDAGLPPGPYVVLRVRDTGKGIPEADLASIFEPYFTTKEKGEGTGLGLSVCQGAIKSMKGEIFVESSEAEGTCFTIFLPALEGYENRQKEYKKKQMPGGNESILFVDDEVPISKMGRRSLESLGYRVQSFHDPEEALAAFRAAPESFDLVITDMAMPEMTGDILAKEVKRIKPGTPVILCTGYSRKISEENALEMGLDAFCPKPLYIDKLAALVRQVLD